MTAPRAALTAAAAWSFAVFCRFFAKIEQCDQFKLTDFKEHHSLRRSVGQPA
jgi:hypothetical protein